MGHGDAINAGRLHFGVGTRGRRYFAMAFVGQTQLRIAELRTLHRIGFLARLDVTLERLVQRTGGMLMQLGKMVHGFFSAGGNAKGIAG